MKRLLSKDAIAEPRSILSEGKNKLRQTNLDRGSKLLAHNFEECLAMEYFYSCFNGAVENVDPTVFKALPKDYARFDLSDETSRNQDCLATYSRDHQHYF